MRRPIPKIVGKHDRQTVGGKYCQHPAGLCGHTRVTFRCLPISDRGHQVDLVNHIAMHLFQPVGLGWDECHQPISIRVNGHGVITRPQS